MTNDTIAHKWYGATSCTQKYGTQAEEGGSLYNEFGGGNWICPDIEDFELENNPALYTTGNGTSLVMVVNTCQ